jgi:hypothetical protein
MSPSGLGLRPEPAATENIHFEHETMMAKAARASNGWLFMNKSWIMQA